MLALGHETVCFVSLGPVTRAVAPCLLCDCRGCGVSAVETTLREVPWFLGLFICGLASSSVACQSLAVILVLGGGCGALRVFFVRTCSPGTCEAHLRGYCFGTLVPWFLAPFYRSVVAVLVLGCPVLLAWTYHCFSLGAWSLDLASSSVACHPSPSHGLARLGGLCMSPLFEMLSVLFPGNIGSHFLGISRSVFGSV